MQNNSGKKQYELWRSESEGSDAFFDADGDRTMQHLAPDAELILVIEADSWNEAQQKRYDFMGWGQHRIVEE